MSSVSSTSSSSSSGTVSNGRYWGLASGLNVDSIVTALLSDDQERIDNVKGQETTLEWQQTAYRSIITQLQTFESSYLQLGQSTSMASSSMYSVYDASSDNTDLSVTAGSGATGQEQDVTISQSATSATINGDSVNSTIKGTAVDVSNSKNDETPTQSISFTVDGVSQSISFTASELNGVTDASDMVNLLNTKLTAAFGTVPDDSSGTVSTSNNVSKVVASVDSTTGGIDINAGGGYESVISLSSSNSSLLTDLGLTSGQSNRLNTSTTTLKQLLNLSDSDTSDVTVEVNGKSVDIGSPSTTVSSAFSTLNASGAGVTLTYNSTNDTTSLSANQSGASGSVDISGDTSGFFDALGMSTSDSTKNSATGQDAIVTINGSSYTRPTNNFTINGVNYSINSAVTANSPQTATVSMTPDTSNLETGINNFISAYNTLITSINSQISTEPNSNYPPLTSAESATMTTDQITQYNTDAQQGLLYGDPTLSGILTSMRDALYQPVTLSNGQSVSLFDFGITTSDDPDDNGTLQVATEDEQTFQNALANNSSEISEFFTKMSDISLNTDPETSSQVADQKTRTQQEGLVDRLNDIIQGATSSVGGATGSLLAIAGEENDPSQTDNTIYNELAQLASTVTDYTTQLTDKQNNLYTEFENLETYMESANSQSATLTSMLG
jgi:flagellar hook-associated protein 2